MDPCQNRGPVPAGKNRDRSIRNTISIAIVIVIENKKSKSG